MSKSVFALIVIIFVCSCGKSNSNTSLKIGGTELDSIKTDSTYVLSQDKNSPRCEVSISLLYIKGDKSHQINNAILESGILAPDYLSLTNRQIDVKQAVDSFIKRYINDYITDYGALYRADKEHSASYECSYMVRTKAHAGAKDIMVYVASIYTYGGGAHGIDQTLALNFNMKTGRLLTLKDVFVSGFEQTLKDKIVAKLCDKYNVKDIHGLAEKYIFADGSVYVPNNFMLNDDDITFIYCEDEIAPHALGEIRVDIDKGEINKLLR